MKSTLAYKVAETGGELIVINTRKAKAKPNKTCPFSLEVVKKPLSQRTHTLPDDRVIGRDQAAALVMLRIGLKQLGREPAWALNPETTA